MPISKRRKKKSGSVPQTRVQARQSSRQARPPLEWPHGDLGSSIPPEHRANHIPEDDHYYLEMVLGDVPKAEQTIRLCKELGIPAETSKSPSGVIAFRLHRDRADMDTVAMPIEDDWSTVPVGLPWIQGEWRKGRSVKVETKRRMQQRCHMPYLYEDWKSVLGPAKRRRKKSVDAVASSQKTSDNGISVKRRRRKKARRQLT